MITTMKTCLLINDQTLTHKSWGNVLQVVWLSFIVLLLITLSQRNKRFFSININMFFLTVFFFVGYFSLFLLPYWYARKGYCGARGWPAWATLTYIWINISVSSPKRRRTCKSLVLHGCYRERYCINRHCECIHN